ncbi:hypothetical protein E3N88_31620 [Mikania micrantha]|uniref:Uncharacterized protein n=1 Tax=Mikania micrantha TaxID=192012 RepID=A0A5N6M797_9ASTR|nr:hypothetical protein E3N88_31620 [Mikania micrantha]
MNRDICWEELEWKGKQGQSPAMVATKPHYFLVLDVDQTVENFLENVPEFWSSLEFSDTLKDGDILFLDMNFFINMFLRLMNKEDMEEIWKIINENGESDETRKTLVEVEAVHASASNVAANKEKEKIWFKF